MLKNSGTQEKWKKQIMEYANDTGLDLSDVEKYTFSCYQQTSPLDVPMYAFGYPKTKVLAQFADSKAFFLSP